MRNAVLVIAYIGLIFWLGSAPALAAVRSSDAGRVLLNLYHVPLYAGLAYWVLQLVSRGEGLAARPWRRAALTFAVAASVALLDELYQVVLPSRDASLGDLALDVVGIAGALAVYAVSAREALGDRARRGR